MNSHVQQGSWTCRMHNRFYFKRVLRRTRVNVWRAANKQSALSLPIEFVICSRQTMILANPFTVLNRIVPVTTYSRTLQETNSAGISPFDKASKWCHVQLVLACHTCHVNTSKAHLLYLVLADSRDNDCTRARALTRSSNYTSKSHEKSDKLAKERIRIWRNSLS
ncbi:hypothetical protein BDV11DRAFT_44325 [Aspergillus similis]